MAGDSSDLEHVDDEELDRLISRADLDELVRLIDRRSASADWPGLLRTRDRSISALKTGRQVWPAATLAEYRLALLAPAEWAGRVVRDGAGRFAPGPLTEVVAQHHRWNDLAPYLEPGPVAGLVAQECVLRGERLDEDALAMAMPNPTGLPLTIASWEPEYLLATYHDSDVTTDPPTLPPIGTPEPNIAGTPVDDAAFGLAARQLVEVWATQSNGSVVSSSVAGDRFAAVEALGEAEMSSAALSTGEALRWLAWAASSGGAHGRRRGAAAGRFAAWWLIAALGGVDGAEDLDPDEIGEIADELRWHWWDPPHRPVGWALRIAVEDPHEGLAWAINAADWV